MKAGLFLRGLVVNLAKSLGRVTGKSGFEYAFWRLPGLTQYAPKSEKDSVNFYTGDVSICIQSGSAATQFAILRHVKRSFSD